MTTIEVAQMLGMSVRSVQLMVDRGELQAWKTPGGHRRIYRESIEHWRRGIARDDHRADPAGALVQPAPGSAPGTRSSTHADMLLIDDSIHFQKLLSLVVARRFPEHRLAVADDAIAGLAMYGQLRPSVLIVDIMLPGIDGATLITSLRSHSQFADSKLVVVTSLDVSERGPYAFALEGVPVIHKPRLVVELPPLLSKWLHEPG